MSSSKTAYPYQIKSYEDYQKQYKNSIQNPNKFWASVAKNFSWIKPWETVMHQDFETARTTWFQGAQLNITINAIDRHLNTQPHAPAIIWEPNGPSDPTVTLSYIQLHEQVCTMGHVLKRNGIVKGDRVCIYMPMVPELSVAVLACARIGAVHNVVFGGFSAQSITDRVIDAQCKLIITTDGANRGPKEIPMKETVDEAMANCPSVQKVICMKHTHSEVNMHGTRDVWWHQEMEDAKHLGPLAPESMEAEDPLFILYTSGSTGKPKGVVHTCGGYMVWATYTFVNVFQYQPGQIHFCTADIGWITGHSYIIYGPLCAGGTSLMFEGIPTYPKPNRFWQICEKHKVNIFYTAPTAIRSLMACGIEPTEGHNLSHLKVLGTVGEPINQEAWEWYNMHIGHNELPIVDTWWQTENGGIMISNLAGITPHKATFATLPLPGILPQLVNDKGEVITDTEASGNLVIAQAWPGIIRTTWGNHQRCIDTYFSTYPGKFFTGDGCLRNAQGQYRITGRVDDVLNVSGHRIGTAELEDAIDGHPDVIESAIVGYPHDIKGQGIYAYVTLAPNSIPSKALKLDIIRTVSEIIGPIAKPDKIQFASALPKTRSGKIMRRILRKIAEGELQSLGDTSTLLDPSVVQDIIVNREI